MGFIYKITNQINNKVYIGQTKKTIEERFNAHIKKAEIYTNRYLYDAMNHYGYNNFKVEQIEECEDTLLNEREIYWISHYQSNNKNFGYNMTAGGEGGDTWSNNPHKVATSQKIRNANLGSKRTPEQRARMSAAQKGVYYIPVNKEDFLKDIKNMMSIEEICEKYQLSKRSFYKRCKDYFGKTPTELRGDRLTHTNTQKIDIDKEILLQYLNKDYTLPQMAKELNISAETVRKRIIEHFGMNVREVRKYVKQQR